MVPVARRDELYRRLEAALADPGQASAFESLGGDSYTDDRAPRYRSALKSWFKRHTGKPATFSEHLELSETLFNRGLYFDTHEHLEGVWKKSGGLERLALQGLIQLAAAFHKLELEHTALEGALYLLEKGLEKARACEALLGFDIAEGLALDLQPVQLALKAGHFSLMDVPPLRWTED